MTVPLTERIKKYNAAAPAGEIARETISLFHPEFTQDWHFTRHPVSFTGVVNGETVTFQPYPFDVTLPDRSATGRQEMQLTLFNSGPAFMAELQAAAGDRETPIDAQYNVYFSGDAASHIVPVSLKIAAFSLDSRNATGEATRFDTLNRPFPGIVYRGDQFPGLVR